MTNLIFFGSDTFSLPALKALIDNGWPVSAVVTQPDKPRGRGQRTQPPRVKKVAQKAGIDIWQPDKVDEILPKLKGTSCQWAVLAAYGQIIPPALLDSFKAIINIHPSLLPRYRGPSPIETTIIDGQTETGVSLMKLAVKMDAGPVYIQEKVAVGTRVTRPELYSVLADAGAQLLVDNLHNIISGDLLPKSQNEAAASYTSLLKKSDGQIDWSRPAGEIERQVRAYLDWPKSTAKLKNYDVIITQAKVVSGPIKDRLVWPCGEGWLEIEKLIAPSGRTMSGRDFLNGYLNK